MHSTLAPHISVLKDYFEVVTARITSSLHTQVSSMEAAVSDLLEDVHTLSVQLRQYQSPFGATPRDLSHRIHAIENKVSNLEFSRAASTALQAGPDAPCVTTARSRTPSLVQIRVSLPILLVSIMPNSKMAEAKEQGTVTHTLRV
jgi:hypothetical protein